MARMPMMKPAPTSTGDDLGDQPRPLQSGNAQEADGHDDRERGRQRAERGEHAIGCEPVRAFMEAASTLTIGLARRQRRAPRCRSATAPVRTGEQPARARRGMTLGSGRGRSANNRRGSPIPALWLSITVQNSRPGAGDQHQRRFVGDDAVHDPAARAACWPANGGARRSRGGRERTMPRVLRPAVVMAMKIAPDEAQLVLRHPGVEPAVVMRHFGRGAFVDEIEEDFLERGIAATDTGTQLTQRALRDQAAARRARRCARPCVRRLRECGWS